MRGVLFNTTFHLLFIHEVTTILLPFLSLLSSPSRTQGPGVGSKLGQAFMQVGGAGGGPGLTGGGTGGGGVGGTRSGAGVAAAAHLHATQQNVPSEASMDDV